jgi:hypothetical protein
MTVDYAEIKHQFILQINVFNIALCIRYNDDDSH